MPYIDPEVIKEAKRMDLFTYLKTYEPGELVKISDHEYCTKSHDSLKISNGLWMWWSRGIGGKTALEYLIKVKDMSFLNAVETIMGHGIVEPEIYDEKPKYKKENVLLPSKSATSNKVFSYLLSRGIDQEIIEFFLENEMIYESLPYHNVVFLGYGPNHEVGYAAYRATNSSRIMGDCSGSNKEFSFRYISDKSTSVHLFESAIDLMSYATLMRMQGKKWKEMNLISLAGVYSPKKKIEDSKVPRALETYLLEKKMKKIILHLDSDQAGRIATQALICKLSDQYEVVDCPPRYGKDFNDFLCIKKGILKRKMEEKEYGCR